MGADTEREGRVEMCSSGRWGTVCGTHWTNRHTAVVCRYLGYSDLPIGELHISIRVSVDALCRDGTSEISHDPPLHLARKRSWAF